MAKTDNLIRATDFAVYIKGMRGDWVAHPDTGRIYSNSTGDFLKPAVKAGYPSLRIRLSFGDKEIRGRVSVHRAMWVLCRGIPLSLDAEVDHIDQNKENNRLDNLRLVPPCREQKSSVSRSLKRLLRFRTICLSRRKRQICS